VQRLGRELPDVSIFRSSDVLPQIKEYERVSTTIVNAYVGPVVRRYLTNLELRLAEAGYRASLFVILSHGGMPRSRRLRVSPGTVLSGPAGGMSGARRCADLLGFRSGAVRYGRHQHRHLAWSRRAVHRSRRTGCWPGNGSRCAAWISPARGGGGSIASVDAGKTLRVGPESAGAVPGRPATAMAASRNGHRCQRRAWISRRRCLSWRSPPVDRRRAKLQSIGLRHRLADPAGGCGRHHPHDQSEDADGIRLMTLRRGVDPRGLRC